MGGPNTRAAQAMALVVAHVTREQVFNFWPIKQPNASRPSNRVGQQSTRAARGLPSRSVACSLRETRDCHRRPSPTLHRPPPSPVTPSSPPLRAPVPWPRPLRSALCAGAGRPPSARCDAVGCPLLRCMRAEQLSKLPLLDLDLKLILVPNFQFAISLRRRSPARAPRWQSRNSGIGRVKGFLLFISILC